ncbi:solute carrier family 22 member 5-like [Ctenocephalides felis]|uniref:solute carrier family 22 member 5-like n=1 Tax=Ctenocephalides felis TaxID=7515 RepID=UPI000E6E3480|nr:solute carrier family 22 member 5-like [Ctenocephalides felis]
MGKKDAAFDTVLESVGNDGPFQRRFNYMYNVAFALLAVMPCMNMILAMTIPEHWCHVPGRTNYNYTEEEWKEITLPKNINNKGQASYSSCEMYNITDWTNVHPNQNYSTIKCQHGYEFDKTWFELTIPMQENWVCDKEMRVTNSLIIGRIGEMFGALVFGQLGDVIGRKPVFFLSMVLIIVGKIFNLFLTSSYYWYVFGYVVTALPQMSLYQTVLVIGMEISTSDENSHVAMLQGIGWTFGICTMPLLMWWLRNWFDFVLVSSLPFAIFLINNKYMIESPRWLASRGKMKKCEKTLRTIAKVNGATLNDDALEMLKDYSSEPEHVFGMMSLFTSWTLAKNTIMLLICWVVCGLSYFLLYLNVSNMDGNPFLNYLYQGFAELPAYPVGKFATNYIGRRWTACMAFLLALCTTLPLIYTSTDPSLHIFTSIFAAIIKFCVSVSFYVLMVQGVEVYPTCLRQTGVALGVILGNASSILGPYISYLGTTYDVRYPYLFISLMMFSGLVAELLLPETLHQKLPDTLAEAQIFGKSQKFWTFPRKNTYKSEEEKTPQKS